MNDSHTDKVTFGAEMQVFAGPLTVFDNEFGEKGAVQTDDDLASQLLLFFVQAEYDITPTLLITLGGSLNMLNYDFTRQQPLPMTTQEKSFEPFFAPRIAILKKLSDDVFLLRQY